MQRTDEEILGTLREKLQELDGAYATEYQRAAESLRFESGEQWDAGEAARRVAKGRPVTVSNFTRAYVDRIVNPFILNPVGISPESNDDLDLVVKEFLRTMEHNSDANESYLTAFRNAVICGRGFIHIGSYYRSDESMDQDIGVDTVRDPLTCYLDASSEEIDGSDATYGVYVKYLPEGVAKSKYGVEISSNVYNLYEHWAKPERTVASLLLYIKDSNQKKRQFLPDGRYVDQEEPYEGAIRSRMVEHPVVHCYHIVGEKVISSTTMNMPYIPIIPVYGNRLFTAEGIQYGGIVDIVRDTQTSINYYNASEQELIALSPISPWIAAEGQVEGYESIWKKANTEAYDTLIYKATTLGDKMVPEPHRADNTAQTQGLIQSKQTQISDLGRMTSINDSLFGEYDSASQSGKAITTRNKQGEISTAHYTDNLFKSIQQVGKVAVWLMLNKYDTARTIDMDGQKVEVIFNQLPINMDGYSFQVNAGPSIESRKAEAISTLEMLSTVNPPAAPLLSVRIAENLDVPNKKEIVDDLKRALPPELQEQDKKGEEPDPKAMQALQEAQQTIDETEQQAQYLMRVIEQMQNAMQDKSADRDAKMAEAQLKAQTTLAEAEIRSNTELKKVEMQNANKTQVEADKQESENLRTAAQITSATEKQNKEISAKVTDKHLDVASKAIDLADKTVSDLNIAPMTKGPVTIETPSEDQNIMDT